MQTSGRMVGRVFGIAACALALASLGGPAFAMPVSYVGTIEIDQLGSGVSGIAIGDRFDFAFTYDDAVTDAGGGQPDIEGHFPNALLAFSLPRHSGNTGSWNPAGGTFSMPQEIYTAEPAFNQFVLFAPANPGFPLLDGAALQDITVSIASSTVTLISDPGSGQTLTQTLVGGRLPDGDSSTYNAAAPQNWAMTVFTDSADVWADGHVISVNLVGDIPEPATLTLLALGGLALLRRRNRKA